MRCTMQVGKVPPVPPAASVNPATSQHWTFVAFTQEGKKLENGVMGFRYGNEQAPNAD